MEKTSQYFLWIIKLKLLFIFLFIPHNLISFTIFFYLILTYIWLEKIKRRLFTSYSYTLSNLIRPFEKVLDQQIFFHWVFGGILFFSSLENGLRKYWYFIIKIILDFYFLHPEFYVININWWNFFFLVFLKPTFFSFLYEWFFIVWLCSYFIE